MGREIISEACRKTRCNILLFNEFNGHNEWEKGVREFTSHLDAGKICLFFSYQCLSTTLPAWDWKIIIKKSVTIQEIGTRKNTRSHNWHKFWTRLEIPRCWCFDNVTKNITNQCRMIIWTYISAFNCGVHKQLETVFFLFFFFISFCFRRDSK